MRPSLILPWLPSVSLSTQPQIWVGLFFNTLDSFYPGSFFMCCSFSLGCYSPYLFIVSTLAFRFQLKCHLLREAIPDHSPLVSLILFTFYIALYKHIQCTYYALGTALRVLQIATHLNFLLTTCYLLYYIPFLQWRKWSTKKLSYLPKVLYLAHVMVRITTEVKALECMTSRDPARWGITLKRGH